MSAMLKKVAKAIYDSEWAHIHGMSEDMSREIAMIAVSAMIEPDEEMLKAGFAACDSNGQVLMRYGYQAMVSRALQP